MLTIHDDYIRATMQNIADTTRSADKRMKMPPRIRKHRKTILKMGATAWSIILCVACALYIAARM